MRATVLLITIAALSLAPLSVRAEGKRPRAPLPEAMQPEAEAKALFQAGAAALGDGRYQAALEHFSRSYELSERPELLYNIGVAHDRLRHDREALEAFEGYLAARPDAANRSDVEARMTVLRRALEASVAAAPAPVPQAPTAEQAARAAQVQDQKAPMSTAPMQPSRQDASPKSGRPLLKTWWFWTAIGAAATIGVVAIAAASKGSDDPNPTPGDNGMVISTLVAR